jgi:hypothetical protein
VVAVSPPLLGSYKVTVDGHVETRVVAPTEVELDVRPRPATPGAAGRATGELRASVDASGEVALVLLALMAVEMSLRLWPRRTLASRLAGGA